MASKKKIKKHVSGNQWVWSYFPQHKLGYLSINQCDLVDSTTVLIEGKLLIDKDKNGDIVGVEYIG